MGFKYSGFISYRRMEWCTKCAKFFNGVLKENEENYGSKIFFDDQDIKSGAGIDPKIADGLYESMSLIFLFVPVTISEDHPYCAWELTYFAEYENLRIQKLKEKYPDINENDCKQIIPVLIRGTENDLPPLLRNRKAIDFRKEMLSLKRTNKMEVKAYKDIIEVFNNLRDKFKDFENVKKIPPPEIDFKVNIEKLGYKQQVFPSMTLNYENDRQR